MANNTPAILIEKLTEATGFSRQTIRQFINEAVHAISEGTDRLQQRVSAIMAKPAPFEDRYNEVTDATETHLTPQMKSKLMGALGFGFLGGLLLTGAQPLLVSLVGIILILLAGCLIFSFIDVLIKDVKQKFEDFSF
jgi:hypothetical protein